MQHPELIAAYERIAELVTALRDIRRRLDSERAPPGDIAIVDMIDDLVEERVAA
jgi:hypothetical protein